MQDESGTRITQHRFYRPGLDVVRFGAFLAVFGHHVLPRKPDFRHTSRLQMHVALPCTFFVLSASLNSLKMLLPCATFEKHYCSCNANSKTV